MTDLPILPEPLTPPNSDLTDWPSMLLDVSRLRRSKAWLKCKRTPMLAFYMMNLWTAAWHDKPAASLEDDDDVLADLAMCDASKWAKVRADALHGWVKCSDGRLYHPVVAEKALECWLEHLARTLSSGAGNAKRWKTPFDPKPIEEQMRVAREMLAALNPNSKALTRRKTSGVPFQSEPDPGGTPDVIPPGSQEKVNVREDEVEGNIGSEANASAGAAAPPAVDKSTNPEYPPATAAEARRRLWTSSGAWLMANGLTAGEAKAFINTVMAEFPLDGADAFREAIKTEVPADARAFVRGCAGALQKKRLNPPTVPSDAADKTQEYLAAQASRGASPPPAGLRSVREGLLAAGLAPAMETTP